MRIKLVPSTILTTLFFATFVQAAQLPNTKACQKYSNYAHGMPQSVTYLNTLYQRCMRSGKRRKSVRKYQCGAGKYRYKYNGTWRCGSKAQPDITLNDAIGIIGMFARFAR